MNLLRGRQNGKEAVQVAEVPQVTQSPKEPLFRSKFQSLLEGAKKGDLGVIEHEVDGKKLATVVLVLVQENGVQIVPVAKLFDGSSTTIWLGASE